MEGILTSPSITLLALFAAFGCGTASYYRSRRYETMRARAVLVFTLAAFAALAFYVVRVNPYPVPRFAGRIWAFLALTLLLSGGVLLALGARRRRGRLSMRQIYSLLPKSIRELTPEEMRELLPPRFHAHKLHDARALVFAELSEMSPATLRTLSPEKLRTTLRRGIPLSILDQR